jgi:signal transduction histidine kinase
MMDETLVARLAAHRALANVPRPQLEWLAERGQLTTLKPGELLVAKGERVILLQIILSGHLTIYVDRGAGPHKVMEWRGGDITGVLPYSRLVAPPGDVRAEETTEMLTFQKEAIQDLIHECYDVTAACVHTMVDRVRQFTAVDQQEEKMASLGKLAAGLAHELNNPASAVARSAEGLSAKLSDVDRTSRALGALRLAPAQQAVVDKARTMCQAAVSAAAGRTAIERSDREDAIGDWLAEHDLDDRAAEALAESAITLDALTELATVLEGTALQLTVDWLVAGCATNQLASEIEIAASRIYKLVGAVKGFTYMDQATMAKPVDLGRGLADTLAVLNGKARGRSLNVSLDVDPDLPKVQGFGGELNQIWSNLLDNALDVAVAQVEVSVHRKGDSVVVGVTDDGPGVPREIVERIFDPFFTTKPVGQGTGLGLDIARRIAHKHHGDITLDTRPGRTQFCVTIPIDGGAA